MELVPQSIRIAVTLINHAARQRQSPALRSSAAHLKAAWTVGFLKLLYQYSLDFSGTLAGTRSFIADTFLRALLFPLSLFIRLTVVIHVVSS